MKRLAFLFIALISAQLLIAQYHPMIDDTHTWRGVVYGWGTFDYVDHFDGDSTINFTAYHKLYSSVGENSTEYLTGLYREDTTEQRVYVLLDTEQLVYDFSLEAGEEVTVYAMGATQTVTISSVEMVSVGNTIRRKLNFIDSWGEVFWIEGLGSSYRPSDSVLGPIKDYSPSLQCFYEDNNLAWSNPQNEEPCEPTLTLASIDQRTPQIWPNPVGNLLHVETGGNVFGVAQYSFIDISGRLVYNTTIPCAQRVTLDLQALDSGVYLLNIVSEGSIVSEKIIKE